MSWSNEDEKFMRAAIGEAKIAASVDEVPVGAIVVRNGEVIGAGLNRSIQDVDPSAHAEIGAIRDECGSVWKRDSVVISGRLQEIVLTLPYGARVGSGGDHRAPV